MSTKFLYDANRQFELTRELSSTDEVRSFIDLTMKQKSKDGVQEYAKNALVFNIFLIGVLLLFFGFGLFYVFKMPVKYDPADVFPVFCINICPLSLVFGALFAFYRAVRLFLQPFSVGQTEQIELAYRDLIRKGRCYGGQMTEIEVLSPTTRRIHYVSYVHRRRGIGKRLEEGTFITASSVDLDLSDTVVVLTHGGFRVLL